MAAFYVWPRDGSAPSHGIMGLLVFIACGEVAGALNVPWYLTSGVRFDCTGCSKCCKVKGDVWATDRESAQMAKSLGLTFASFQAEYQSKADTPPGWNVLKSADGPCIFLAADGKCSIYDARPLQCRAYPFWPEVSGSRATWEAEAVLPDDAKGPGRRWSPITGGCEGLSEDAAWIPGPVAALRQLEYALYDQRRVSATRAAESKAAKLSASKASAARRSARRAKAQDADRIRGV